MTEPSPKSNPVVTELVRNGVIAVTEEMKTNLMRTAYNMIIYEALDFTVGLFTAKGETVSIGLGLPDVHPRHGRDDRGKIEKFRHDGMEPGDILLTNDAYITGSHLNHLTFSLPIFYRGRASGVRLLHGALARHRRNTRRHYDGYLFRGTADPDPEVSEGRASSIKISST